MADAEEVDEMSDAEEVDETGIAVVEGMADVVTFAEDETAGVELSTAAIVNFVDGCAMITVAGFVLNGDATTAGADVADVKSRTSVLVFAELAGDVVAALETNALESTTLVENVVVPSVVVVDDDATGVTATLTSDPTGHQVGTSVVLEDGWMVTLRRGAEPDAEGVWKGRTLMEESPCFCTGRTRWRVSDAVS
jgi:hypothetical protein